MVSCKSKLNYYQNRKVIKEACELNFHIKDTVVVGGIYSNCMEYSSFNLIEKDNCYDKFDMHLNFDKVTFTQEQRIRYYEMQGCMKSMKMILKGVLIQDEKSEYGHLGSNNSELEVLEIVYFGKVKSSKIKTPKI